MDECIFCKIVRKEIPAEIVDEDDATIAFLDIRPRSPGHTMVIPKFHAPALETLPDDQIPALFLAVKRVGKKVRQALGADGITYGINQGRSSGQEVSHLHVHVMPRFIGDGGGPIQIVVNNPPKEDLPSIAARIRSVG
jgi:histidine triad (HIT) family protein